MNNNLDEFDKLLFEYFEKNKEVPNKITNGIRCSMKVKNKQYKFKILIKKIIITILSLFTITGGIVFAKEIKSIVQNMVDSNKRNIYGSYNEGITKAVDNGYSEHINMKYIDSNDTKVKVEQVIMDDYTLGIIFNIQVNNKELLDDLSNIKIKDFLIMDENNNVVFSEYENQEEFERFCEENNLDKGKYGIGFANCAANGSILSIQDNNIVYSFYTTSEKFPNSKKLNIKFDKIHLLNKNGVYSGFYENNITKCKCYMGTLNGKWQMDVDIEKMQKERKTTEYVVSNINDNKTTITKASLSMANMRLELITNTDKIDFDKLQNRENVSVVDLLPFSEMYIETPDGKRFYQSNYGGNGYETIENGKIMYYVTFDYTFFDKAEHIKIVMPTNKKEKMIIELRQK